jgi:hypothetical protein
MNGSSTWSTPRCLILAVTALLQRLGGRTLIALDGTEHFCSRKIHCKRCSIRRRSDGGTEYFHAFLGASIVAPGHTRVLPLPPEFVAPQDGAEKQDLTLSGHPTAAVVAATVLVVADQFVLLRIK